MKSLVAVAATLMTVVLAVNGLALPNSPNSNDTVTNSTAQSQKNAASSQKSEGAVSGVPSSTTPSEGHAALNTDEVPAPPGSLSMVVYAAVILTIVAMVYLVVRNFRMRYSTVRAERYGFQIRRGRRDHEVQPLARDDEDEEILFDVRGNLR